MKAQSLLAGIGPLELGRPRGKVSLDPGPCRGVEQQLHDTGASRSPKHPFGLLQSLAFSCLALIASCIFSLTAVRLKEAGACIGG